MFGRSKKTKADQGALKERPRSDVPAWLTIAGAIFLAVVGIFGAVYSAVMTNRGADLVDRHAATRSACAEFVVGRSSMSQAGLEVLRVLHDVEKFDAGTVAEVNEERIAFEASHAIWLRANAELLLIADDPLMVAGKEHYKKVEAAIVGTLDYYRRVVAAGSGKAAGDPPRFLWESVDNASEPVVAACQEQASSGNWFWPFW